MFANHYIKYDVNRLRAQSFVSSTNTGILGCSAKDRPSFDALRARSDLPSQNIEWLNRHDRESGDCYRVLPLMKSIPVSMAIYIDRNMDTRIFKRTCRICSFVGVGSRRVQHFPNGKRILTQMPKVVFVEFFADDGSNWIGHYLGCLNLEYTPSYR